MSSRGRGYGGYGGRGGYNSRGSGYRGSYRGSSSRGSYESRGGRGGGYSSYSSDSRYNSSSGSRYNPSRDRIDEPYKKSYRSESSASYSNRDYGRSGSPERKRMRMEGSSSDRRSHDGGGHYGGSYSSRQDSYGGERRSFGGEDRRRSPTRESYRKPSGMGPPREPPRTSVRPRAPRRSFRGRTLRSRASFRGAPRSRGSFSSRRFGERSLGYTRAFRTLKGRSPIKSKDDASSTEEDWDADEKEETTEEKKESKSKSPKPDVEGSEGEQEEGGEDTDKEPDTASDAAPTRSRPYVHLACVHCKEKCATFAGYAKHLVSGKHRAAMGAVARRHKAQLLRMRVAQRGAQRELEAAAGADLAPRTTFCLVCRLNHRTTRQAHNLTDTHRAMKRFLMPFCRICRITFRSPMIYEHHICSLEHLKIEQDMENYTQYKMGFTQIVTMVKGAMPSKFDCHLDDRKRLSDTTLSQTAHIKRLKTNIDQETQMAADASAGTSTLEDDNAFPETVSMEIIEPLTTYREEGTSTEPIVSVEKHVQATCKCVEKQVQATFKVHYRSKAVQTKTTTRNISLSPYKVPTISTMTSPLKITKCNLRPSTSGQITNIKKKIGFFHEEGSDSDISTLTETVTNEDTTPYVAPSSSTISESDTVTETKVDIEKAQCLKNTLHLINKKPLMYVGISKDCYYIIQLIHKNTNIPIEYILLCLKKIRLNSTFSELEDNFGISLSYGSKLFVKNIPKIASVLRPFLVKLNKHSTLNTLPIAFRHNYYNVSCIIDCLEIDIQKPSKALHQALTWSDYKKANTVKYLVSCTPNGLINFISPGFGGRTSDITIIEKSNFLETLKPGTFVLADRGFKHVEQLLDQKGVKLLRPPSVAAGSKLSKEEVRQTKIIASLRIHVERVIRRLREFHMLKQHAVINTNILKVINDCIIIACALINLQDSLIK